MKKTYIALALVAAASFNATACDLSDGGFLAAVVECAAPPLGPTARQLDRLNGQLGQPVDHAGAVILNGFVPGAGPALEGAWAIQRGMQQVNGGGFMNAMPVNQAPLGNFCSTPAGRFGPGPVNPLGMPCNANTPWGVVFGQVTR